MTTLTVFAPAKLNLFLAITGRRTDGFHDLVSVVAPLAWGDDLTVTVREQSGFTLTCTAPGIPTDATNLVIRAAELFQNATGWSGGADFVLTKRVPAGAGLGGGSSDGTAALKALNRLAGSPLDTPRLNSLAATLGSDCPLFLHESPSILRGRGEQIEPLPAQAARRCRGRRVLVFKPWIGINTGWAYRQMAEAAPSLYLEAREAEKRLGEWISASETPLEALLYNNMEAVAFRKFIALPTLLGQIRQRFGVSARMSGSGSACFACLDERAGLASEISDCIHEAWGPEAFVQETTIR